VSQLFVGLLPSAVPFTLATSLYAVAYSCFVTCVRLAGGLFAFARRSLCPRGRTPLCRSVVAVRGYRVRRRASRWRYGSPSVVAASLARRSHALLARFVR